MLALTEQHLGICVLPSLVVEGNLRSLKALPVTPPLERELGIRIPSLKNASPGARKNEPQEAGECFLRFVFSHKA